MLRVYDQMAFGNYTGERRLALSDSQFPARLLSSIEAASLFFSATAHAWQAVSYGAEGDLTGTYDTTAINAAIGRYQRSWLAYQAFLLGCPTCGTTMFAQMCESAPRTPVPGSLPGTPQCKPGLDALVMSYANKTAKDGVLATMPEAVLAPDPHFKPYPFTSFWSVVAIATREPLAAASALSCITYEYDCYPRHCVEGVPLATTMTAHTATTKAILTRYAMSEAGSPEGARSLTYTDSSMVHPIPGGVAINQTVVALGPLNATAPSGFFDWAVLHGPPQIDLVGETDALYVLVRNASAFPDAYEVRLRAWAAQRDFTHWQRIADCA